MIRSRAGLRLGALTLAAATAVAGCAGSTAPDTPASAPPDDKVAVTAAFYPLQYLAERVGGSHVVVTSLAEPGVEAHELELTPRQVGGMSDADLVLYLRGFQPAVDEAVDAQKPPRPLDVSGPARLVDATEHGRASKAGAQGDSGGGPSAQDDHSGHDHSGPDPHFWLDPVRYADVADAVAEQLSQAAPERADDFARNAAALRDELEDLDRDLADALRTCDSRIMVTGHEAFGYLADRYRLEQVGIAGLDGAEVPPGRLAQAARFIADNDVRTVYSEVLLDPRTVETVAEETGARVRRLDPVEAITDDSVGGTYPEVMRANLTTLSDGQGCRS